MLKRSLVLASLAIAALPALAADIGVSVSVSQPGVYGRVDIGRFPQPAVMVQQPVLIAQPRVVVQQPVQPVYLWVPPGHQKNWGKHCGRYQACGVPVYFVQDDWYHQHVMADQQHHGKEKHGGKHHGKGKGHDKD